MYSSSLNNFNYLEDFIDNKEEKEKNCKKNCKIYF